MRAYVTHLRPNGAVVNIAIVMSCAEEIIKTTTAIFLLQIVGTSSLMTEFTPYGICEVQSQYLSIENLKK